MASFFVHHAFIDEISSIFKTRPFQPLSSLEDSSLFVSSIKTIATQVRISELVSCILACIKHQLPNSTSFVTSIIDLIRDESLTFIVTGDDVRELFQALRLPSPVSFTKESIQNTHGVLFRQDSDSVGTLLVSEQSQVSLSALPVHLHESLLSALAMRLLVDSPNHVKLAGDKDSFISLPSVKLHSPREYAVCMWIYLEKDDDAAAAAASKGFLLFRCRSAAGGIDAIASDRQADHSWNLTIRSQIGNGNAAGTGGIGNFGMNTNSNTKTEVSIRVIFAPGKWNMVSIRHLNGYAQSLPDRVTVSVDGVPIAPPSRVNAGSSSSSSSSSSLPLGGRYSSDSPAAAGHGSSNKKGQSVVSEDDEAAHNLLYPFRSSSEVLDTQWAIGLGLRGRVHNFTVYCDDMPLSTVRSLHLLGRYIVHMAAGVSSAQTTFDTGYLVLGSNYTKGSDARRACRHVPQLAISVDSFTSASSMQSDDKGNSLHLESVPQVGSGRQSVDHVIMTPYSMEGTIAPLLNGGATLCRGYSLGQSMIGEGGVVLCLQVFSCYCSIGTRPAAASGSTSDNSSATAEASLSARLCAVLRILAILISMSVECKEHFVQVHGFHIIAHCLGKQDVAARRACINEELVVCVANLVSSLGEDCLQGDGIASALQGLLLDFRVWGGEHALAARTRVLRVVAEVCAKADGVLYGSVGTQRLLDLLRLYIFRSSADKGREMSLTTDADKEKEKENMHYEACANYGQQLLECALSVALARAEDATLAEARLSQKPLWHLPPPGQKEIERVLACLQESRSSDLAERLLLVLWDLRLRGNIARTLLHVYRQERFHDTAALNLLCKDGFSILARKRALGTVLWSYGEELRKVPDELVKLRTYETKVLGRSTFKANTAGNANGNGTGAGTGAGAKKSSQVGTPAMDNDRKQEEAKIGVLRRELMQPLKQAWFQIQMLMRCVDQSISSGAWALLGGEPMAESKPPAAATAANGSTVTTYDDFLAVMAHDGPLGTVKAWLVLPFLVTFLKKGRASASSCQKLLMSVNVVLKTDRSQGETLSDLPGDLWIPPFLALANVGNELCARAAAAKDAMDQEVSQTCVELALDGLATVLECCTRLNCEQSFDAWRRLEETLREPEYVSNELPYLKRCVCLVLQRLSRNGDAWNADSLSALVNIFNIVESRSLCANWPISIAASPNEGESSLLISMQEHDLPRVQTHDERQILCFVIDIMASLRAAAQGGTLRGLEQHVLRPGVRIMLGCLRCARGDTADRISAEAIYALQYMSEKWGARNANDFKKFFLRMVGVLRCALADAALGEEERGRYQAHVYSMMHHFLDVRHALASGGNVSKHVLPTLDLLTGVDSCNDINTIFDLIRVNFAEASTISFQDDVSPPIDSNAAEDGFPTNIADLLDATTDVMFYPPVASDHMSLSISQSALQSVDLLGDDSVLSVSAHASTANANQNQNQLDSRAQEWLSHRQGIVAERVEVERTRLSRFVQSMEVATDAVGKHWMRVRNKLDNELFATQHRCEWKLGVAHEGSFPGRRRLVLRPRRLDKRNVSARSRAGPVAASAAPLSLPAASVDEVSVAELGRAMKIYIRDAAQNPDNPEELGDAGKEDSIVAGGSDWGNVEENGREGDVEASAAKTAGGDSRASAGSGSAVSGGEGAKLDSSVHRSSESSAKDLSVVGASDADVEDQFTDVNGDLSEMDTAVGQGRVVETGPAHPGSRRFGSGAPIHEAKVILITASGNVNGVLSFNEKEIFFASTVDSQLSAEDQERQAQADAGAINLSKRPIRRRRWVISALSALYLRRFRLRDSAIEMFFRRGKHRNFFVDFGYESSDVRARDEFAKKLIKVVPASNKNPVFLQRPTFLVPHSSLVRQHGVQDEWLAGKLSNFDYLMALNTIAGRSYNDLCQYPIMPWVIAQYTEKTLDLSDPATFRDLSKPMGALNESRLEDAQERYDSMEEEYTANNADIPPFMYGSHYSTMVGVVLHFLMRLQPFASLHCEMQGGRFDVADRLFSSIPRTWHQNTTHLSEVKELTPEWFTTPEMFQNVNKFDLGYTQEGEDVGNVVLPPWASSAEQFVHLNRQALESDYVSAHLHEWIDLIFGYKQTGAAAVEANNVFFYLTYYNAVDRDRIDEALRQQIELQIAHFGQMPLQLFTAPHPAKKASGEGVGFLSSVDVDSPRPLRRCFSAEPQSAEVVGAPLRKNERGEYSLSMNKPANIEEAAASNSKATSVTLPARIGAPRQRALSTLVLGTRIVCVLGNGVLEVLKFCASKAAKQLVDSGRRDAQKRTRSARSKSTLSLSQSSAVEAAPFLVEDSGIISFEDVHDNKSQSQAAAAVAAEVLEVDDSAFSLSVPLIQLDADRSNFDTVPRLLLSSRTANATTGGAPPLCHTTRGTFLLSGGYNDGSVCVRGVDGDTGYLCSSGDFRAHRSPVVCISTDHIQDANTDVVVSVDDQGHVLVWTISGISAPGTKADKRHVISRRPQRCFRMPNKESKRQRQERGQAQGWDAASQACAGCYYSCDIVWQMGVVATACGSELLVFSVERDELIRALDVSITASELRVADLQSKAKSAAKSSVGAWTGTGRGSEAGSSLTADLLSFSEDFVAAQAQAAAAPLGSSSSTSSGITRVRRVVMSDRGRILLHLEYEAAGAGEGEGEGEAPRSFLAAQALAGNRVALQQCHSPVTFLACPDHGDIAISGHLDGSVNIYDAMTLDVLYALNAPLFSLPQSGALAAQGHENESSAVICCEVGPDPRHPAVLTIATHAGVLYVKSLPDFMSWERINCPSTLSQVVNAPIKVVRGVMQSASSAASSLGENAGVLAHSVKGFADDAVARGAAGLEALGAGKLVSGISSWFSGGKKTDKK